MQSTHPSPTSPLPMRLLWSRRAALMVVLLLIVLAGWLVYRGTDQLPAMDASASAAPAQTQRSSSAAPLAQDKVAPVALNASDAPPPASLPGPGETEGNIQVSVELLTAETVTEQSVAEETVSEEMVDEETRSAAIAPSALDPGQGPENAALNGVLATFRLEPLAAPCCPLPTPDKAVEAAQGVPGVLAASVGDDDTLLVRYVPAVTDPDSIASAVNQASFIVELVETDE